MITMGFGCKFWEISCPGAKNLLTIHWDFWTGEQIIMITMGFGCKCSTNVLSLLGSVAPCTVVSLNRKEWVAVVLRNRSNKATTPQSLTCVAVPVLLCTAPTPIEQGYNSAISHLCCSACIAVYCTHSHRTRLQLRNLSPVLQCLYCCVLHPLPSNKATTPQSLTCVAVPVLLCTAPTPIEQGYNSAISHLCCKCSAVPVLLCTAPTLPQGKPSSPLVLILSYHCYTAVYAIAL